MKIEDDRTEEQLSTHTVLIAGTDKFMSGWGEAENGTSYAVWACMPRDMHAVWVWVKSRGGMLRVRKVSNPYRPKGTGHTHIYVVHPGHPSLI